MFRVKIIRPGSKYKVGDIVYVSRNEAFGLLDSGYGVKSKDMVAEDYKINVAKYIPKDKK